MTGSFIDDLKADGLDLNNFDKTSANPHKQIAEVKARPTFPCESCRGTGRYQGVRLHQPEEKCFACKGKGYFFKSYADRMAGRQKSAAKKQAKVDLAQTQFAERNPGLMDRVRAELLPWNSFAVEMVMEFDTRGSLTENQVAALHRSLDKNAERQAERAAAKQKELAASVVDPSGIRDLFESAKSRGLKKPGLWFGEIKISEAPATGRNAGALYVKLGGEYAGKIIDKTFHPAWGVKAAPIVEQLLAIATDPATVLREKGRETGTCCCCGRPLTDPVSIAAGIGPICATSWGL